MTSNADGAALAELAGLFADPTRANLCLALLDGRAWTASELARHAGVAASTASAHLDRLVGYGLLRERRQGRYRYLELAGPEVATLLEELMSAIGPVPPRGRTLRAATVSAALARARTCYDHLAGRLGVAITDAMIAAGLLNAKGGLALTDAGLDWFIDPLGVDPSLLQGGHRPLVRACLDWTERRTHLAGSAGAQLCHQLQQRRWIRRISGGRAVQLTPEGEAALHRLLGLASRELALAPPGG